MQTVVDSEHHTGGSENLKAAAVLPLYSSGLEPSPRAGYFRLPTIQQWL